MEMFSNINARANFIQKLRNHRKSFSTRSKPIKKSGKVVRISCNGINLGDDLADEEI